MVPDLGAPTGRFEVLNQPVRCLQKFVRSFRTPCAFVQIVVAQTILRYGDGIVLKSHLPPVIQHGDPRFIVLARVIRLGKEGHIVFCKFGGVRLFVDLRVFVPEGEMALPGAQVGGKDPLQIGEASQSQNLVVWGRLQPPW